MIPVHVLKHLLGYVLKRKEIAIAIIVLIFIAQVAELAIPLIVGWSIDQILISLEEERFSLEIVFIGAGLIILASIVRGVTHFTGRYLGYVQGERAIFEIRKDLFEKYEHSSLAFFDNQHTGDLMARATVDLDPIGQFLVWGQRIMWQAVFTFLGIYLVLFLVDVRLFLIILVVTPALFILSYFISRKLGPLYFKIRESYGKLTTTVQENISGAQVVRAFKAEKQECQKFDDANLSYMNLRAYAFKIRSLFFPLILLIVNVMIAVLIFAGGLLVIQKELSVGTLVTLLTYFLMLARPTRFLAFSLIQYQRTVAAGDRIFKLLESNTELPENPNAIRYLPNQVPTIIFDKVSFAYEKSTVLNEVNLKILPGEKIAILGPTGSGKSTLLSIIPRFYDPINGQIIVDIPNGSTHDLKDLKLQDWRRNIGIVQQEPFLFDRTVTQNIAFGTKCSEEEVQAVAKIAQAHDFIQAFPDSYDTVVGERGVTLSGGEKQRIAIARMLLSRPSVILMDDSTSSLDTGTEMAFQTAFEAYIEEYKIKPIVIFVTQRLSTIKLADRIIILNRGSIVEHGTHEELLKMGKIYPILWKTQEKGIIDIKLLLEQIVQEMNLEGRIN